MTSADDSILAITHSSAHTKSWKGQWLGMLGLFLLLSFTWLPNSYTLMVSWPYALLWQGAFGLLVSWGIWMSRQFLQPFSGLGHRLDPIVLFMVLGSALSSVVAQFKLVAGWNFLLFTSYGIGLYLTVSWLRHRLDLRQKLWFGLAFSGTITSLISLSYWRPTAKMWTSPDFYAAIRNPFPLGHHNFVGGYCLLVMPLIVGFTLTQAHKWRWLGYGAVSLNIAALYISGSRGALVGALALVVISLPLYFTHHPPKTRKSWIALVLIILLTLGAFFSNPRMRSLIHINPSANLANGGAALSINQIDDGPTKDRLFMLEAGQNIFKSHPLLGVGSGNLARVYNLYRPLETGGGLELVQQLHNTPAQILAELGIIGLSGYLLWLGRLLMIGIALHKKITHREDRILLYSIGASWFAYAISSLSDYQLENIGIASTLLITTVLLISLADTYLVAAPLKPLAQPTRRLISLCLLLYLSVLIQTWARADAGFYLADAAQKAEESFNFADADAKWMKASQLIPWDPTYAALAAEQLVAVKANASNLKNNNTLTDEAIVAFKTALKAAPNDPWFNQNLAVLLLDTDPQQAEAFVSRTALLLPRSQQYTYYTLGLTYLKQQKKEKAIAAFVLESLANPIFLTDPLWENQPFADLRPAVANRTLTAWQQVLDSTSPNSNQFAWLQQQMAVTQWWQHQLSPNDFTTTLNTESLSPLIQAILQIEEDPKSASNLLAQIIKTSPRNTSKTDLENTFAKATLLQAWLTPEQHLAEFLKGFKGTPAEKQTVIDNIRTHRDLRKWLTSVTQPNSQNLRYGLAFAYRNAAASNIHQILSADGLSDSPLLNEFNLFSIPPREFPQLDQKMADIAAQDLALIPPSQNHFQLPPIKTSSK